MSFRGFASRDFGTGEYKRLALRYPGCRNTETPYLIRAIIISGFRKSGFRDYAITRGLRLRFPGCRNSETLIYITLSSFRGFASRDFGMCEYKRSTLGFPGSRNSETSYSIHAKLISGFRKSGFRDWRVQGNLPLGIPGAETPKHHTLSTLYSFRGFASRDFGTASTRELTLRYPGCRNTETPNSNPRYTHFGVSQVGISDMRVQGNLPLGIPGAETPKHQTLSTLYHFGVSQVGISGLASTRNLPLGIPGAETPKHQTLTTLYHFGVSQVGISDCEYKETYPWVSRVPKHRNTKL
jgi:hypothetical protein